MAEVLAAYCFLAAFVIADPLAGPESPRRMAAVGVLLGLAVCFRVQMGPALLVFAILRCRGKLREAWLPLLTGGAAVLVLDLELPIRGSVFSNGRAVASKEIDA
jgi:hypothetical protein